MNYLSKLFSTGAVRETPKKVIETLVQETHSLTPNVVVEIGAGRGELTSVILRNQNKVDAYYAFEIDHQACHYLQKSFSQVIVKRQDAFSFSDHIVEKGKVDLFISSIPLSFYSRNKIKELLASVKGALNKEGKVIIVFTAFWLIAILKKELPGAKLHSFFTFPPYFLIVYQPH